MTTKPYRVLVTGSRDWKRIHTVFAALDTVLAEQPNQDIVIVQGACPTGADRLAFLWAAAERPEKTRISTESHPADWAEHGRAAGPIRNKLMVNAGADVCLAFIRNGSRGASHTAQLAEAAGIPVRRWTAP